jgi:hypothetical protein
MPIAGPSQRHTMDSVVEEFVLTSDLSKSIGTTAPPASANSADDLPRLFPRLRFNDCEEGFVHQICIFAWFPRPLSVPSS